MDEFTDEFADEIDDLQLIEDLNGLEARKVSLEDYPATKMLVDEHGVIKKALDVLVNAVKVEFRMRSSTRILLDSFPSMQMRSTTARRRRSSLKF